MQADPLSHTLSALADPTRRAILARLALGQWLALPAYLFLAWLTEGARWFARVPWASLQLPPFPRWVLLGYYAIVVGGWLWDAKQHRSAQLA